MTRKIINIILIVFLLTPTACGKSNLLNYSKLQSKNKETIEGQEEYLKASIIELTSDITQGREGGTKGEAETALLLARRLKKLGIKPAGDNDTYFQVFPIKYFEHVLNDKRVTFSQADGQDTFSSNVIGEIPAQNKDSEYLIISAHYDHLGKWNNQVYLGANDNASGVAVVLEIARLLIKANNLKYNCIIAFWGSEEKGLLGSHYYAQNLMVAPKKIKGVINLDSVGSGTRKELLTWGNFPLAYNILTEKNWQVINEDRGNRNSDHSSFYELGIPASTFLAHNWLENNHTTQDTIENLNLTNLKQLSEDIATALIIKDSSEVKK